MMMFIGRTLCAQVSDSLFSVDRIPKKSFSTRRITGIAIPALMVTYGVFSLESKALQDIDRNIKTELYQNRYMLRTSLDDYLQFSPAAATFGLKTAGVKSRHNLCDMTILYALSNLLETGIVHTLKSVSSRMRPDGSAHNSFPSGHTATAFVAAEFLHQEYRDESIWISVGGYAVATLTGCLRISNNRHWFSDVVAGAGIGILSVKAVYWAYPSLQKIWRKKDSKNMQSLIFPSFDNGVLCLSFSHTF
jgi:membrane-associated phospholipid phosphatase